MKTVNPFLLQQLFEEGIYVLPQDVAAPTKLAKPVVLPASHRVMLYVYYPEPELPAELQTFLDNVQKALPVPPQDKEVVLLSTRFQHIDAVPIAEKFISFGAVQLHDLQRYHVYQKSEKQEFVLVDEVTALHQNITLKKQLRDALQILFDQTIKK